MKEILKLYQNWGLYSGNDSYQGLLAHDLCFWRIKLQLHPEDGNKPHYLIQYHNMGAWL